MNSPLPHFGVMVDVLRESLELGTSEDSILSERTIRTISSGGPVKQKSWDEYGTEFVGALITTHMFPLNEGDRQTLIRAFHAYRLSYEQLSELLSRFQTSPETIHRAVLRLQFLDMAIRYAALCFLNGWKPADDSPSWARPDGANQYWRRAVQERFPGVALVGSSAPDGDCASLLKMNSSKMRRCLYENDIPDPAALGSLFPDSQKRQEALRHYAAFKLCRQMVTVFGEKEVEFWVWKMIKLTKWLNQFFEPMIPKLSDEQRSRILKRMLIGGVGDSAVQRMITDKLADHIPPIYRSEMMAMAKSEPTSSVRMYVEFCDGMKGPPPPAISWEEGFDIFRMEFDNFQQTGAFPEGKIPTARLQLARFLAVAEAQGNKDLEERILRRIIKDFPLDADAHQLLAQLCENTGRKEESWREFELAAAMDPNSRLALFGLADAKSRSGQHMDALAVVERIPAEGVGPGSRSFLLGLCLTRAGNFTEAMPHLEDAYQRGWEPGSSAALLAHSHSRAKTPEPASPQEAKKWEKRALHHGLQVKVVLEAHMVQTQ